MGCPASGEFDGEPDATAAPGVGSDGRSRWPARTARRAGAAGGGAGTGDGRVLETAVGVVAGRSAQGVSDRDPGAGPVAGEVTVNDSASWYAAGRE